MQDMTCPEHKGTMEACEPVHQARFLAENGLNREAAFIQDVAEDLVSVIDSDPAGQHDAVSGVTYRVGSGDPVCVTAEFQVVDSAGEIFTVTVQRGINLAE